MSYNLIPTRREFLKSLGLMTGCLATGRYTFAGDPLPYDSLKSDNYLGKAEIVATVEHQKIFTEGPAVDRAGNVFFTNVPPHHIMKYEPATKKLSVFRENSNAANGLMFDPQGRLIACEGGAAENGRVTRTDMATGKITTLVDEYNGHPLGAPNDLTLDGEGRIYFTSRLKNTDPAAGNLNAVYRIDPDGTVAQVLKLPATEMPNGIVTSPDNKLIHLIEAHPDADKARLIRTFDLKADGTFANPRVLINFYPGRSGDGMCIDSAGNLYVAAGLHNTRKTSETLDTKPGIHVISPAGKLLAYTPTPVDTITNCTFGGPDLKTLYVACGPYLLAIPTKIAGKASYRPNA